MPKAFKVRSHTKKAIHPQSRKASQLARAAHRKEKIQRKKEERSQLLEARVGEKCRWFFEHIDERKQRYAAEEVRELIEEYLQRFDAELQKIEQLNNAVKGRQGRIYATKEDNMKTIISIESELFNTGGLEVPDLTSAKNFELFKEWNCDMKCFSPICMKAFTKSCPTESRSQVLETRESIDEETEDRDKKLEKEDMNCSS
ncbi:translation machinery-associated protein 16-like [Actinia tenebrosa]|uniref:Translation machinery-associated protein 16-like n=1 Tax=Actinia tenebrosa TaxID=6105 RepID=A0A6P8HJX9_ACTTE|nr:translation machinery-associated protein 16-like [Actinia tenebrosa]